MLRLCVTTLCLLAGLTACQQPTAGPTAIRVETNRGAGDAAPPQPDPQYLLTANREYVLSSAAQGVEVRFASKLVHPVGWQNATDAPSTESSQGQDGP